MIEIKFKKKVKLFRINKYKNKVMFFLKDLI